MSKTRLEAFSDGVIAILITIMVLELKVPATGGWQALETELPTLATYVVSFVFVGIYWNNHHHMFSLVEAVNGQILWANLHLLFWLSLVPFVTTWVANTYAAVPTSLYGVVLLACALAWLILQRAIVREQGARSPVAAALGRDFKGFISPILYVAAVGLAFVSPFIADALYVTVALMWLVPDRRFEAFHQHRGVRD